MTLIDKTLDEIENEIQVLFPDKTDSKWLDLAAGEKGLAAKTTDIDHFIRPCRELLFRGGKRWRPLVMVLSGRALGNCPEAIKLSPLVEIPHNGSLIIDDIEDASLERRGAPSVHLIYGNDLSVNAGNLMYFLPDFLIDKAMLPDSIKLDLYREYNRDLRRLHLGQGFDIAWHNNHDSIPEEAEYLTMCRFKTGSLARMAGAMGALLAGQRDMAETAGKLWENIGVGFQILDDYKNLSTGNPGKHRGDDIVEGKKSLPVIKHLSRHPEDFNIFNHLFSKAAEEGMENGIEYIEDVITRLEDSGSLDAAGKQGEAMLTKGLEEIKSLYPDNENRGGLVNTVESFIEKMLRE